MLRPVRDAQARDEGPKEANDSRLPTCQTRQLAGWPVYESEWLTARLRELKSKLRSPGRGLEPQKSGRSPEEGTFPSTENRRNSGKIGFGSEKTGHGTHSRMGPRG